MNQTSRRRGPTADAPLRSGRSGGISAERPFRKPAAAGGAGFAMVMLVLLLEYIRPQSLIPALEVLHLPLIASVLSMLVWFIKGEKQAANSILVKLYFLFLVLSAASIFFAVNHYWVFQNSRVMFSYLMAVVLPMGAFITDPARLGFFLKGWLAIQLGVGVIAIVRGGTGAGGFLQDENDLAMVATMAMPYAYFLAQSKDRSRIGKLFCYGTLVVLVTAVVLSQSRGGFVALVAAAAASVWFSRRRIKPMFFVALIGIGGSVVVSQAYIEEMETITNPQESTASARLYSWRRGWDMFLDNPVFGVGSGNYPWRVVEYELKSADHQPNARFIGGRMAHSLYFTLLPEYGLVGTGVFTALVIVLFARLRRLRRELPSVPALVGGDLDLANRAIAASLATYFTAATFVSVLYYPAFWIAIGFVIALENAIRSQLPATVPLRGAAAASRRETNAAWGR